MDAASMGIRRGWIKVVIIGDIKGNIVDVRVGNEDLDERKSGRGMLRKNSKNVKKAMMDGLHDCEDTFKLCRKLVIDTAIILILFIIPSILFLYLIIE